MKYDVFLSHNRLQKSWVRELYNFLKGCGLSVFFDEESIEPGASIVRSIDEGLSNSRHIVVILSDASLNSPWVMLEADIAAYSHVREDVRSVIPIIIDNIDESRIPRFLRAKSIVDLRESGSRERKVRQLLAHLGCKNVDALSMWQLRSLLNLSRANFDSSLRVATFHDVYQWGWNSQILLEKLLEIDFELMEGLSVEHAGSVAQWAPAFDEYPDTWRVLVNSDLEIGAYWHFVPLFEDEMNRAKSGTMRDSDLTLGKIAPIGVLPGIYNIYIVAICIKPFFRSPANSKLLFESFLDALLTLGDGGCLIDEVIANAYTPSGEGLCKGLQMIPVCNHVERGHIFRCRAIDFLAHPIACAFPRLKFVYEACN